jgi:uncharacterized membrane protein
MQAGQQYQVSVTMRNTGSNTWTAGAYKLGPQNPHDNANWGPRIDLAGGDSIGSGQEKTFTWTVTAPSGPGSYNFQWRMLNVGVEWFGELSTNVVVSVQGGATGAPNAAEFVSQSVPSVMQPGQQYQVSVTMQNAGSNTWTAGAYKLGPQNPHDNTNWGPRVDLAGGDSIGSGQQKTFTWTVTAPSTPGLYNFQWRMLNVGVEWFGQKSQNVTVKVQSASAQNAAEFVSQSVPGTMQAGQPHQVSVRFRNSGDTIWDASYRLGAQNPWDNFNWGMNRVALGGTVAPGVEHTVVWTVTAPSTPGVYNFQWKMIELGVEWFGPASPNVVVTVQ